MMMSGDYEHSPQPSTKLEKLHQFAQEAADPHIAEFAEMVATRLEPNIETILPIGYLNTVSLMIYDLEQGVDGHTNESIDSELVGLTDIEYRQLMAAAYDMAKATHGKDENFLKAIEGSLTRMGVLTIKEPSAAEQANEDDLIKVNVTNIARAQELIVLDARVQLQNLGWEHFDISKEEVGEVFDIAYALILNGADIPMPLNLFIDEPGQQKGILAEMHDDQKTHITGNFWLGMTMEDIPPAEAMAARDHLLLKSIDVVAQHHHLDLEKTVKHFLANQYSPAARARTRLLEHIVTFYNR